MQLIIIYSKSPDFEIYSKCYIMKSTNVNPSLENCSNSFIIHSVIFSNTFPMLFYSRSLGNVQHSWQKLHPFRRSYKFSLSSQEPVSDTYKDDSFHLPQSLKTLLWHSGGHIQAVPVHLMPLPPPCLWLYMNLDTINMI